MDQSLQRHALPRPTTAASGFAFLERRLTRLASKRSLSQGADDTWGPFGLILLSAPPDPLIDLIFVHGLRGGSRKTWSFSDNHLDFWPREWLPRDTSFKNVRIHSFGYKSDYAELKESVLNIHDFGKALLGDVENSPDIRGNGKSNMPMIFVGHSMGGLVIKKAYLLARQDPQYHDLANRFHTILFLATPHRGADSASTLNNILKASFLHSPKAYVSDLDPRSAMLQIINDEFRLLYGRVQLWSFYETSKTPIAGGSILIVEKDSAVMGLPEERTRPLNGNHRQVCKFEKPTDNDYVTVRNTLVSTVDSILKDRSGALIEKHRRDMRRLGSFLGIFEKPEEDLEPEEDRVAGSCEWLIEKESFHEWMEETQTRPKFFLLSGNPGTGKSVLTSYTIRHLEKSNKDCSYFFFSHMDKVKSSIGKMLRSLAYQMALTNMSIRDALLALSEEGEQKFDQMDERILWRKLFSGLIFRTPLRQEHFWVIDALDECHNYASLVPLLAKIDEKFPLRVFISTRATSDLERLFQPVAEVTTLERMSLSQTQADIRLYVEANIHDLPVEGHTACRELTEKIVEKSKDCFLWAHLVLRELAQTFSEHEIMEVLNEVPEGMAPLYTRILEGMSKSRRNIKLIKALLTWTVCARRPLEVNELKEALKLDLGTPIPRLDRLIQSICGEMIYVDKNSKVQLIHQTAREFLLGPSVDSEFAVNRAAGHTQLATTCLRYLLSEDLSTPWPRKKSHTARVPSRSCFMDYASTAFSEHMVRSDPSVDLPLTSLDEFLKTHVLTWIEHLATTKNLPTLMRTAKNLKAYLQRRAELRSPLGKEVQRVGSWSTDFIRLATGFGDNLVDFPFAIYFLIPPLCPSQSSIHRQFASNARSLEVLGLSATEWNDRLSCIIHREDYCSALASRDSRFAVGLQKGIVVLYNTSTCREVAQFKHGERVRGLEFAVTNTLLVSSSRHFLKLWNCTTGTQLWAVDLESEIMAFCFQEDDTTILAATKSNKILSWRVSDAKPQETCYWHDKPKAGQASREYQRAPTTALFSTEFNILGIVYRSKPLILWDLEENSLIGTFDRIPAPQSGTNLTRHPVASASAVALAFNFDPNNRLLAIAYQDGDMMVIDPIDREVKTPVVTADVSYLAASPDGKTLAAGDAAGTIKLYNFETLELMYRIACSGYAIRGLAFSSDGLRFLDIRGPQCNVWEPAVLVRKTGDDSTEDSQDSQDGRPLGPIQSTESNNWRDQKTSITALVTHGTGQYMFCAKQDGSVWICSANDGSIIQELYRHAMHVKVVLLVWNEQESLLASADLSSRFLVRKITIGSSGKWMAAEPIIDTRSEHPIQQLLFSPDGDRLLVSNSVHAMLWDMTGTSMGHYSPPTISETRSWITHPVASNHLLLFSEGIVRIFDWMSLEELTTTDGILLETELGSAINVGSARTTRQPNMIILEHVKSDRNSSTKYISLWKPNAISPSVKEAKAHSHFIKVPTEISSVIGVYGSLLVFLNYFGWICTLSLNNAGDDSYTRHFFVPSNWFDAAHLLICQVTAKGEIVFVQENEIAVIKDGLSFEDVVELEDDISRHFKALEVE